MPTPVLEQTKTRLRQRLRLFKALRLINLLLTITIIIAYILYLLNFSTPHPDFAFSELRTPLISIITIPILLLPLCGLICSHIICKNLQQQLQQSG